MTTTWALSRDHLFTKICDDAGLTRREFPVLIDKGNRVAQQFGLVQTFSPALIALYKQYGINLAAHNGDDSWTLPLPAVFVIDQTGVICHAEVQVDYRLRSEPTETLAAVLGRRSTSRV